MTSTYKTVRKDLAEKMGTNPVCNRCGHGAEWKTLSDHGGMCFPCYSAYCREVTEAPPKFNVPDGPKAWAYRLQAREADGERLAKPQREAWREVLGAVAAA